MGYGEGMATKRYTRKQIETLDHVAVVAMQAFVNAQHDPTTAPETLASLKAAWLEADEAYRVAVRTRGLPKRAIGCNRY
jgi:hypothetical protein